MATILKTETPVDTVIAEVRAVKERLALQMGCNVHRIAFHAREGQSKRPWLVVNRRSEHLPASRPVS